MSRMLRFLLVFFAIASLFPLTGWVLVRHARVAPFLRARDRLERGEDREKVLSELSMESPADAGPWKLLRTGGAGFSLMERTRHGWREVR